MVPLDSLLLILKGGQPFIMAPALFALLLVQPGTLPMPPALEALTIIRKWSFWQKDDQEDFDRVISHLRQRNFRAADRGNRALLARAPKSIFDEPPTLPLVVIRPSGSGAPLPSDKPVSGWLWRRESAWLSVWAGENETAFAEFRAIMAASPKEAPHSVEGALFALSRMKRWNDCLSLSEQSRIGSRELRSAYQFAAKSNWEGLRNLALGADTASGLSGGSSGPKPSLSGAIGGGGRSLPPAAPPPLLPQKAPTRGPSWASVEASLIILDSKMTAWRQRRQDQALRQSAVFWINILLRDAREAFPHHRHSALTALDEFKE